MVVFVVLVAVVVVLIIAVTCTTARLPVHVHDPVIWLCLW